MEKSPPFLFLRMGRGIGWVARPIYILLNYVFKIYESYMVNYVSTIVVGRCLCYKHKILTPAIFISAAFNFALWLAFGSGVMVLHGVKRASHCQPALPGSFIPFV